MKFSIATWAFYYGEYARNPWPIGKILEWTARAGYEGTEFCGFRMPSAENVYDTPEKCAELMSLVHQNGLEAACYAAQCRTSPASLCVEKDYLAQFEKALRFCVNCSIPVMRIDTAVPAEDLSDEEYKIRFDRLISNWRAAARLAADQGVLLAFESEPPMWINKPSEVLAAVEAVNEKNFKLVFDPSHGYLTAVRGACQSGTVETLPGGVLEYIHMLGHHIGYVHMIDTNGELSTTDGSGTSVHTPIGEGILDIEAIAGALWPYVGKIPYWSLDYYACRDAEHTGIESLKRLRKIVERLEDEA